MMSTHHIDTIRKHDRAENLAFAAVEFIIQYVHEVAGDEPIEIQQKALHIAGRMLAPVHNGCYFRLPPMDEM